MNINKTRLLELNADNIINMFNGGKTCIEIGQIFNCSDTLVRQFLKKNNILTRRPHPNCLEKFKEEIINRYLRGESIYSIHKNIGVGSESNYNICMKKWGFDVSSGQMIHHAGLLRDKIDEIKRLYIEDKMSADAIAKKYNMAGGTNILRLLKKEGVNIRSLEDIKKYNVNKNYFNKIDTPNRASLLGFLYADGNIDKNKRALSIHLAIKDIDILFKIKRELNFSGTIKYINNKSVKLIIHNVTLCRDLLKWGCMPNKTWKLRFPTFLSDELLSHFMRGYFEGDGAFDEQKLYYVNFTGNHFFIEKLAMYMPCDITNIYYKSSTVYPGDTTKKIANLRISKKSEVKKFISHIYGDCNENHIYLDRKYKLAQQILQS